MFSRSYFDGILQIQSPAREETLSDVARSLEVATRHDLPVVIVQHEYPAGAPVFGSGSARWALHPEVEKRLQPAWKRVSKDKASVFAGTDVPNG